MPSINMMNVVAFCIVVKTRSISKAARILDMHNTTITRSIKTLQQEVGQTLLVYNGQFFELTEAGKQFYMYHREVADVCFEMAHSDIKRAISVEQKRYIQVAAPTGKVDYLISNLIKLFRDADYTLKVRSYPLYRTYDDPEVVERLIMHADIAIVPSAFTTNTFIDAFKKIAGYEIAFHWVAHRDYVAEHGITAENFAEHVYCAPEIILWDQSLDDGLRERVLSSARILVESIFQAGDYIKQGLGVGLVFIPEFLEQLRSGELVLVSPLSVTHEYVIASRIRPRKGEEYPFESTFTDFWKKSVSQHYELQAKLHQEFGL